MMLPSTAALGARLGRLRALMAREDLAALIVTHRPNVFYLTNFASSSAIAVVTPARVDLLADPRYTTALDMLLASGSAPPEASAICVEGSYDEALAVWLLDHASGKRVGFEAAHLTVKRHTWLVARLGRGRTGGTTDEARPSDSGVVLVPLDDLVEGCRLTKDAHEVGLLREAARRLSQVARDVLANLVRPGRTEQALAADIDHCLRQAGFERPAFETIVASGPNSALPHAVPTDRPLSAGDLLVLDFGGVYGGYCVDLTRTVALGEPSDEYRRLYRAVAAAQDAALSALRPGITSDTVDAAARDVLAACGFADFFRHGTGHGLGLEVHEEPRLGRRRDEGPGPTLLEPGMVVTIEPGAYVPGLGGVRLEDDALVTATGAEKLTDVPRDEPLLGGR
jgi:Xaa-Pro aminopeptidase